MASLRKFSEHHCKYEAILDDMLRDRLVCGVRDRRIQQRLLAETDITLQRAMELALACSRGSNSQLSRTASKQAIH